ncbi:MAG: TGS domain-containing protein, partial [Actinobacteria bacterium]|nr:TGS domain-containing protein [Actinomycetota bacterium]
MTEILITLPDGSQRSFAEGSTAGDVAASIGSRLAKAAVAAVVNGDEADLTTPLTNGATVAIITGDSDEGRHVLRHSTSHVMAQAVLQLFPGAKYSIGPAITDGFYYDFELPANKTFSEDDLVLVEARMRQIMSANQPFIRSEMSIDDALALFADQPYKCEIIERVRALAGVVIDPDDEEVSVDAGEVDPDGTVSVYRNTDEFVDMCRGPHVPTTSRLGHFKLMKVAGAYWRGNEKGPMLQRI